MKIKNIKQDGNIFIVDFIPTWLEGLFGGKPKTEKYKKTSDTYEYGGGSVYVDKNGYRLGNRNWIGDALDAHQRKF